MAEHSSTPFDQGLFLVHLNRGREHFDKRNFANAAEELEEARRLRPEDDSVLNLLGLSYFKQERYKQADSVYRKLIELNPDSYTLHFNLGLICFKVGDMDRAETTFLRALELKPDNQKTHFYLGNIYEKKKQYYNAIFQYRKAGANIMVKRVQEKIDLESPEESPQVDTDFTVSTSEESSPSVAVPTVVADGTPPDVSATGEEPGPLSPEELQKINVDHIDRNKFLNALQEGLFTDRPSRSPDEPRPATEQMPSGPRDVVQSPTPQDREEENQTTSPDVVPKRRKPVDTQEEVLSTEERSVIANAVEDLTASTEQTIPPQTERTIPSSSAVKTAPGTRLRVTEPVVEDRPLDSLTDAKVPAHASEDLFSDRGQNDRRHSDRARVPPAESVQKIERDAAGRPKPVDWSADEGDSFDNLNERMRRRDDIFRYLEDNLLEVNFSGKVFIKQGSIYSYGGNLTFWVKPHREGAAVPLVIVSGTGKLLLTDRERAVTVLRIKDEEIFVEPSHLLACEETLTPRYAVIEGGDGTKGVNVLMIKGSGVLALSVTTSPLLIPVQKNYPINVSSSSLICWSGDLTPAIVEDETLAEVMQPGPAGRVTLRLEGEGRVMMERSSG